MSLFTQKDLIWQAQNRKEKREKKIFIITEVSLKMEQDGWLWRL